MRKLFVSFSTLVYHLIAGKITPEDLATGLFYFGCARDLLFTGEGDVIRWTPVDHVIEKAFSRYGKDDVRRRRVAALIQTVREHLVTAEREGRIEWRPNAGARNTYEQLNTLLVRHGLAPLTTEQVRSDGGYYTYPGVQDRVEAAGLPLDVVS